MFLGATDLETEGSFVWDYSREFLKDTYTAWGETNPSDSLGNEDYLEYIAGHGWNDISVNVNKQGPSNSYLCEKGKILVSRFARRVQIFQGSWEIF